MEEQAKDKRGSILEIMAVLGFAGFILAIIAILQVSKVDLTVTQEYGGSEETVAGPDQGVKRYDRLSFCNLSPTPVSVQVRLVRYAATPDLTFTTQSPVEPGTTWGHVLNLYNLSDSEKVMEAYCKILPDGPEVKLTYASAGPTVIPTPWLVASSFWYGPKEDGVEMDLCGEALMSHYWVYQHAQGN